MIVQKLVLTSKWGRISPAVQWYYQNQTNCIVQQYVTSGDIAKKFVTHRHTHTVADKMDYIAREPLLKKVQANFLSKILGPSIFLVKKI